MNGSGSGRGEPVDAHLALLHRFEQRGLRLRRRAVDLVGEQQVGEHRTGSERELTRPKRHRAGEVRRQHVGSELHPAELDADRAGERVGDQRLGDAGNALEQEMTADGDRGEQHLDHAVLADHDLAHFTHHAIAKLVHGVLPSSCDKRETISPECERGVVVGRRVPDRGPFRFGVAERDRGPVDLFERGVGPEMRASRDRAFVPTLAAARAR